MSGQFYSRRIPTRDAFLQLPDVESESGGEGEGGDGDWRARKETHCSRSS